ncbi:MAG: hypothetical protein D6737_03345 [Chloroflexi bacterium]|nr:MAG: hypothetical protein D6737_03345 [Chloroflexota bacterium]
MPENPTCQYCGGEIENPQHKSCQWCNEMIQQANCDGVFSRVYDVAMSVSRRDDLLPDARRAEMQAAYDRAMNKA